MLDLETTGFSRSRNHIIEVAAQILKHDGVMIENGSFTSLIQPPTNIPPFLATLTGITDEMVMDSPNFSTVIQEFFKFINNRVDDVVESQGEKIQQVIFVTHNGMKFDLPFLMSELQSNDLFCLLEDDRLGYAIDTLALCKIVVRLSDLDPPNSYKLNDLYRYVTGKEMEQLTEPLRM